MQQFLTLDGTPLDLESIEKDSFVIMRITKEMTNEEFHLWNRTNSPVLQQFSDRRIGLVVLPHWIEIPWKKQC